MLATAIILFREILEIALILCVVLAATQGLPGRTRWVWIGIGGGIAGSVVIALCADAIASALEGMGQEILNAAILLAAAGLIAWTVVWMSVHGREIANKMKQVGNAVKAGEIPFYSLAVVVALAVFREGAEIVLFSYGLFASGTSLASFLGGTVLGVLAGTLVGALLYYGLLQIPARYFFSVTGILLTLLAAGMASTGVGYLTAVGYLPELGGELWDSSTLLSQHNFLGEMLHILLGYTERPSVIQLITYVLTIGAIFLSLRLAREKKPG